LIRDRVKSGVASKRAKMAKNGDSSWGRKPLELELQEKIKNLRADGTSFRNIAKQLKISLRTVQKYLDTDLTPTLKYFNAIKDLSYFNSWNQNQKNVSDCLCFY
jgi:DNA invertase Pin-like site-specific DNA recombinase